MTLNARSLLVRRWNQAKMFSKLGNKKPPFLHFTACLALQIHSTPPDGGLQTTALGTGGKKENFIPAFCHNLFPFFFFSSTFASQNKLVSHTTLVRLWLRMAHLSVSKGIIIPLGSFAFSELWQVRGNSEIIYNDGSDSESSIICSCPGEFTLMHSSFMDNGRARTTNLEK